MLYFPGKAIRLRLFFILLGSGVALGSTSRQLWAAESVNEDQTRDAPKELAIATDHPPDHPPESATEVAREVLRLQQQLGGSIVRDRPQLQNLPTQDLSQQTKVAQLREIALLLDTQAHHLEELDLYEQADALRDVATRLRHDARRLRQAAGST